MCLGQCSPGTDALGRHLRALAGSPSVPETSRTKICCVQRETRAENFFLFLDGREESMHQIRAPGILKVSWEPPASEPT